MSSDSVRETSLRNEIKELKDYNEVLQMQITKLQNKVEVLSNTLKGHDDFSDPKDRRVFG